MSRKIKSYFQAAMIDATYWMLIGTIFLLAEIPFQWIFDHNAALATINVLQRLITHLYAFFNFILMMIIVWVIIVFLMFIFILLKPKWHENENNKN
ncbi:hypothetical protein WR164_05430 [Philodulcilactobacillus myokoensis]|uniref:Uncharacterized protein n=1 Tax=Philodulcilactobacillus myokoensis TaxID=2929573 RepID=A0A9W6B054_9LACO|nr:hypothetical protein [Philodulcilactobacillus myokoensis]GLB46564.1 hypothetical protein WR164_05430 [Philodulcilactobacillus myokoensis]